MKTAMLAVLALAGAATAQTITVAAPATWDVKTQGTVMPVDVILDGGFGLDVALYDLKITASGVASSLGTPVATKNFEFFGVSNGMNIVARDSVFGRPFGLTHLDGEVFSFDVNLTGDLGMVTFAVTDGGTIPADRIQFATNFMGINFATPYSMFQPISAPGVSTVITPAPASAAALVAAGGLIARRRR